MTGAVLIAALSAIALGGILVAVRATFLAGLLLQVAGAIAVAVAGFAALAGEEVVGATFTSAFDPRFGVDGLSGFFLGTLGLVAAPALVFSTRYLDRGLRGRVVGTLTAAFLLALAAVVSGRPRGQPDSSKTSARRAPASRTRGSSRSSRSGPPATSKPGSSSGRSSSGRRLRSSTRCSTVRSCPPRPRTAASSERSASAASRAPRGATSCVVERVGDRIARLRLRTGSYANWPVVAHAAADNLLPDFPLINKSFELCYACADR